MPPSQSGVPRRGVGTSGSVATVRGVEAPEEEPRPPGTLRVPVLPPELAPRTRAPRPHVPVLRGKPRRTERTIGAFAWLTVLGLTGLVVAVVLVRQSTGGDARVTTAAATTAPRAARARLPRPV